MPLSVDLKLSQDAAANLKSAGRLVSKLIQQMVRDEALIPKSSKLLEDQSGWRTLSLGDYRTIFREVDENGNKVALVAAVAPAAELDDVKALKLARDLDDKYRATPAGSGQPSAEKAVQQLAQADQQQPEGHSRREGS